MKTKTLFLTITSLLLTINMIACAQNSSKGNRSSATFVKNYPVEAFDQIDIETVAKVEFTQSDQISLRAEGDEKAVNNTKVSFKDGELKMRMIDKKLFSGKGNKMKLTIYISAPQLTKIKHAGVGTFILKDKVEAENLKIEYEGVGNLIAENLICENLNIEFEGVGNVKLNGKAHSAKFNSEGVGNLQAEKFEVEHLIVRASGVGSVKCNATESIDISSEGVGSVTYWGNPETKNISKNGIGKIKEG